MPEGGTLISNPPYGERLNVEDIEELYREMGFKFKHTFKGYNIWLICNNEELHHKVGLKPSVRYKLNNGGLDCELLQYVIFDGRYDELRERGEHIRNEGFRASERSKGNFNKVGGEDRRGPRRDDDRRRGPRRDDDRRGPRRDDDRRRSEDISDEERRRRANVARDRRLPSASCATASPRWVPIRRFPSSTVAARAGNVVTLTTPPLKTTTSNRKTINTIECYPVGSE